MDWQQTDSEVGATDYGTATHAMVCVNGVTCCRNSWCGIEVGRDDCVAVRRYWTRLLHLVTTLSFLSLVFSLPLCSHSPCAPFPLSFSIPLYHSTLNPFFIPSASSCTLPATFPPRPFSLHRRWVVVVTKYSQKLLAHPLWTLVLAFPIYSCHCQNTCRIFRL